MALLLPGPAKEAALLAPLAGRNYDHAPQQNAFPLTRHAADGVARQFACIVQAVQLELEEFRDDSLDAKVGLTDG